MTTSQTTGKEKTSAPAVTQVAQSAIDSFIQEGISIPKTGDAGAAARSFPSQPVWKGLRATGTELGLGTGDLEGAAALWCAEFLALTTNNTLLYAEVKKGIYDDLIRRAAGVLGRNADPRAAVVDAGTAKVFDTAQRVYETMHRISDLPVNVDFFSAVVYHALGIHPETIVYNHLNQPRELAKAQAVTTFFAAAVLMFAAACESTPPPQTLPEITFSHMQPIKLNVREIEVVSNYRPPMKAPNVEHLLRQNPEASLRRWANDRLRAVGSSGTARLVITNASIVETALAYRGVPYRNGGSDPKGFDCSGLVQYAYGQAGIRVPRTTAQQFGAATRIDRREARPGDLLFFRISRTVSHVGIYIGNGEMIHAPAATLTELASVHDLNAGDLIATGTPACDRS